MANGMSIYSLSMTDSLCGLQLMVILLPQRPDSWDNRCVHIHRLKFLFKSSEMIPPKLIPPHRPTSLSFFISSTALLPQLARP